MTSISCKIEPAIWSHDTGQRIRCFDRCQLIITWMSNIKEVHGKLCQPIIWSMAAILCDSIFVVVAVVVRTRSRAIPLAMIIMRKFIHGLPFLFYLSMVPHMTALRATVAPLSLLDILNSFTVNNVSNFSFFRLYLYCVPKLVWDFPSLQGMDTLIKFLSISKYSFNTSSVTCVDFFDIFGVYIIHFIS